jgi:nucleoside-diphosphate-sugar epimerase
MSTISIVGGHGKIALLAASELAAGGHTVRSLIRKPEQTADVEATGAEAVVLDVEHATEGELATAFAGSDAVIFTAGAGGSSVEATFAVDRDGALKTIAAVQQSGVPRLLQVSYIQADDPESTRDMPAMAPYQEAKHAADEALRAADLDWVIVRPGTLNDDEPTRRVAIGAGISNGTTSRGNVAAALAFLATTAHAAQRVLNIVDGDTELVSALEQL